MAHRIEDRRSFNPIRYYTHQASEQVAILLHRKNGRELPNPFTVPVEVVRAEKLHGFDVKEIDFTDPQGSHTLLAVDLTDCSFTLRKASQKNRKTTEVGAHAALPLGPVEGEYTVGYPQQTRYKLWTNAEAEKLGSEIVEDRFPGLDALINDPFSGGVALKNGKLEFVDKNGIKETKEKNQDGAQLFFSFASDTVATLASQRWTHFGQEERIGSSAYTWSWYYTDGKKILYLCTKKGPGFGNNMLTIDAVNVLNTRLAQGQPWKAALADSGLGGGFVIRNDRGPTFASHPNPELFHSVPAILIAKPPERKLQD